LRHRHIWIFYNYLIDFVFFRDNNLAIEKSQILHHQPAMSGLSVYRNDLPYSAFRRAYSGLANALNEGLLLRENRLWTHRKTYIPNAWLQLLSNWYAAV